MILIADSGSTKTAWCVMDAKKPDLNFETEGYNPYFVNSDFIAASLDKHIPTGLSRKEISAIHFYGAGCLPDKKPVVQTGLNRIFPNATVHIELDLLAAARALLGNTPGFAAILGTGTNTCQYNGKEITLNIESLGFILGDEGSGGAIGKKLLGDFIRGYMPEPVHRKFLETFHLDCEEILHRIYTQPMPNRYCAGFCRYVGENIQEEYFFNLVKSAFNDFFQNLVSRYPAYQNDSFNCVGSLAYHFRDILMDTAAGFGMKPGRILSSPMEGLTAYHRPETLT